MEGQGKSSIAPTFQSGAIITVDEVGVDEMGVDKVGSRRSGNKPFQHAMYSNGPKFSDR